MNFFNYLSKILPIVTAEAHCDIPCGIYEPTPAKLAAQTVLKMVLQIKELKPPKDLSGSDSASYLNSVSRRLAVKEAHAELCKKELLILWSDFFKPEHLEKYPNLHDIFWKAVKLCSKNKQGVSEESAKELAAAVDEIAKIFYGAKNTPEKYEAYQTITEKLW